MGFIVFKNVKFILRDILLEHFSVNRFGSFGTVNGLVDLKKEKKFITKSEKENATLITENIKLILPFIYF